MLQVHLMGSAGSTSELVSVIDTVFVVEGETLVCNEGFIDTQELPATSIILCCPQHLWKATSFGSFFLDGFLLRDYQFQN